MDNPFFEMLREAKREGTLLGVHDDPSDPRGFVAGWVEALSQDHVLLRHLSPHGRYDGYRVRAVEGIFRLDTGGRYLDRLRFLSQAREERFPREFLPSDLPEDANLIAETLSAARRHTFMATVVVLDGDDESGWVKDVGLDSATIARVDHFGMPDCDATVHIEAITAVNCDDESLQDLRLLARGPHVEPPSWLKI